MATCHDTESPTPLPPASEIVRPNHLRESLAVGMSGYSNGCRCAGCTAANTAFHRARRAKSRASRRTQIQPKSYTLAIESDPSIPRISLEYAAGFFDGEGCVNITGGRKKRCNGFRTHIRVMITNTDKGILDLLHWNFGGRLTKPRREGWKGGNWKANRALNFSSGEAIAFLRKIRPHLRIKGPQVDLAFEFWEFTHRAKEERFDQVLIANTDPRFNGGKVVVLERKLEVMEKELWFKEQMHILNRKGIRH